MRHPSFTLQRWPSCGAVLVAMMVFSPLLTASAEEVQPSATLRDGKAAKDAEENRQKEAEEAKRLTELFLRNQGVFLRKGEFMLEWNTFYNRNSRQELVEVPGGVAVARTTRRFFDSNFVARYGVLTDGLEIDVIAPIVIHAEQETDLGNAKERSTANGFGDIALAIRYQAWYERGIRPSLILDAEAKSRTGGSGLTGTGNWNAGGGVTLMKTIDPVVFFGRVGYAYTFPAEGRNLGNIFDYRLGMGFSLNDRVSFTIQLIGALIEPSHFTILGASPGERLITGPIVVSTRRLELMNLAFTTTVLVTKHFFVEPFVGVALTEDAFTMIGLRMPYRF